MKITDTATSLATPDRKSRLALYSLLKNTLFKTALFKPVLFKTALLRNALLSCLLLACINSSAVHAELIYKVTDKDGNVIFTDTLPVNQKAETVELSPTNTQPILVAPKAPPLPSNQTASSAYTNVSLTHPVDNQTIPPGHLDVVAQLSLTPQLQQGHLVLFFMDGEPQGQAAAATSVSISSLRRGTHRIYAQVIDSNKVIVARSDTVTIHVKRHSIKH